MDKKANQPFTNREKRLSNVLWHRMTRWYKENTKSTGRILRDFHLSNAQGDAISRLGETDRMTQQELAEKLLVTQGSVAQLLNNLEKAGLIQREKDWKTNYVSLTDQGRKLHQKIVPVLEQYQTEHFSKLTIDEQQQLLYLLRKLQK